MDEIKNIFARNAKFKENRRAEKHDAILLEQILARNAKYEGKRRAEKHDAVLLEQILARNAKYQEQRRIEKRDAGLHEVRGCWLPKWLHARVKAYASKLAKTEGMK